MVKAKNYHVKMPEEGYRALQAIAAKERRVFADVVREALEQYAASKGYAVSFDVPRGGPRRGQGAT